MAGHKGRFSRDFFVALVGSLVLLATLTGIFWIEREVGYLEVTWETMTLYEESEEEEAVLGADADRFTFDVDPAHGFVEFIEVIVEWTPADTHRIRVSITAPNGTMETFEQTGGQIWRTITVLDDWPAEVQYYGDDEQAAVDAAWDQEAEDARQAGHGTWEVSVRLVDAPRSELLPGVEDPQSTPSSGYSLTVKATGWEPLIVRKA